MRAGGLKGVWLFRVLGVLLIVLAIAYPVCVGVTGDGWWIEAGLIAALLLLWTAYESLVKPVNTVAIGMDLLKEQDYSSRMSPVGQRDADKIVGLFNDLMARLKVERLKVREQNHFLDLLIEASPKGILSYGFSDKIVMCNSMARKILGEDPVGKTMAQLNSPLAKVFLPLRRDESATVRLSDTMVYRCSHLSFMDQGYARPFLLIESLTDEVRKAERAAYEKVIRVMGHEVNNSMASIRSLLDLLDDIRPWGDDEDLTNAVEGCAHRAEALSSFISAYSKVVKIPPLRTSLMTVAEFMAPITGFLVGMAKKQGVTLDVSVTADADYTRVAIDTELLEQAIINIVKNAIESIRERGEDAVGHIDVSVKAPAGITVTDNGPGISEQASASLFTPFFSTKPSGQGLGLMFVAEILTRHKASFSLVTSTEDSLTRFTINFPPSY